MPNLITLPKHSDRLYLLLSQLPSVEHKTKRGVTTQGWYPAADWLRIAASIDRVTMDITRFDESVLYCGAAWEYESKRNELLTRLVTKLSVFNFIWGGLETVIKTISPDHLDIELAKKLRRKNEVVDRAILFLKHEYDPMPRLSLYDEMVFQLRQLLSQHPSYSEFSRFFREDEITSISGLGFHIVRKIRNDFAHGSAKLPEPSNWGESGAKVTTSEQIHLDVIEISSRILLLTIQMLLLAFYNPPSFSVSVLKDGDGLLIDENIDIVLRVLHLADYEINQQQMKLQM
jgi:hypothetical protein